ncbi:MAG: helix-turn-helix domain-containing protein [Betaproteobacteria bacterium]|nr:helix-turn-helix domain-containing protein [Betaproteobacteria bacterium]
MKTPLRLARERRELTIVQISAETGIDPGNLSRIERGCQTPSTKVAERLAKFFNNEVTELQILFPERYVEKYVA